MPPVPQHAMPAPTAIALARSAGMPDRLRSQTQEFSQGFHCTGAAMTAALREATAEYEVTTREGDEEAHLAAMEAETGAAVALVSTGPSARDKRWRRR